MTTKKVKGSHRWNRLESPSILQENMNANYLLWNKKIRPSLSKFDILHHPLAGELRSNYIIIVKSKRG